MILLKNAQCKLFVLPFTYLTEVMQPEKRNQESISDGGLAYALWLFCWRLKIQQNIISQCLKFHVLLEIKHKLN